MPNLTLSVRVDLFPVGTSIGAYPRLAHRADAGTPAGSALESAAVASNGTVTFTTLAADTPYAFFALVGGQPRWMHGRLASSALDRGIASGTGNTTNGSANVTSATATVGAFLVGQAITGPGIPRGTYIKAISGGTLTLTRNATATGTGVALEATGGKTPQARNRQRRAAIGTS